MPGLGSTQLPRRSPGSTVTARHKSLNCTRGEIANDEFSAGSLRGDIALKGNGETLLGSQAWTLRCPSCIPRK